METPRPLRPLAAGGALGLAIDAAQVPYVLWRDAELAHHLCQFILQTGGVRELLPLQRSSEQMETILVGRFRDLEFVASTFVDRTQRCVQLRRKGQRHGDCFPFLSGKVREMFFGETLEQALQLAREADQCVPCSV